MNKFLLTFVLIFCLFSISNARNAVTNFDWKEFVSAEGGFKASFPAAPVKMVEEQITSAGKLWKTTFIASLTNPEIHFGVVYADLINPPAGDETALKNRYDFIRDGFVQKANYQLLTERDIRIDEKLGRELVMKEKDEVIYYQSFIIGTRSYQVIATTGEASAKKPAIKDVVEKFLTSFQPIKN